MVRRHDIDTIYHLAALLSAVAEERPHLAWSINMGGLYNVLEVARQYRCRVFFPSSIGAFGPSTPRDHTPQVTIQRPTTMYGVTKVAGELLCDYYAARFGVDTRGLRLPGLISYVAPPGGGTTDYAVEIFYQALRYQHYRCFLGADDAARHDVHAGRDPRDDRADGGRRGAAAAPQRLQRDRHEHHARRIWPAKSASTFREFVIDYQVDPVRQSIADSWPRSLDDSAAREDWGWAPRFDLASHDRRHAGPAAREARRAGRTGPKAGSERQLIEPETLARLCMPIQGLSRVLAAKLDEMTQAGRLKGKEAVIRGIVPAPAPGKGPRYLLEGEGDKPFLRMNSNSYLGMSFRAEVIAAEEEAVRKFGTGPGAVRFISGTWSPHTALEQRLARFHGREAAMLFSSAYATMMGVLPPLITDKTAVISDALNHNCIINAIALARPAEKHIYRHLDLAELERCLAAAAKACTRAIVVTDGIFSMRGDHAPLDRIMALARQYDAGFPENVVVVVDDSHGVGAFGQTGRGTEEYTKSGPADVLVATLGKAFGVNGGYVAGAEHHRPLPARDLAASTSTPIRSRRPRRPPRARRSTWSTARSGSRC